MNPSPDLAELIEMIATDDELRQGALAQERSPDLFAELCAALAKERSLSVSAEEVRELLRARTIAWHQRILR